MHFKGMRQNILNYPVKILDKTFRDILFKKNNKKTNNNKTTATKKQQNNNNKTTTKIDKKSIVYTPFPSLYG